MEEFSLDPPLKARPLIAVQFADRTQVGLKDADEAQMWRPGDIVQDQLVTADRLRWMRGSQAQDVDEFRSEYVSFASEEAHRQYEAYCEDRLLP